MEIHGFAAYKAKDKLKEFSYKTPALKPYEVLISITHCGMCHSDVHLIDNDWSVTEYPFVPGHEIVGKVKEMGSMVDHLKKGQRVGVGWHAGSCMHCDWCNNGEENFCDDNQATCVGRQGGYADAIVVDGRFAFPIPDALDSASAAPLLCGGITVYTPLRRFNVKPSMKVGVVGIGGLGHFAVQFARAWGCEVTAFSTQASKEKEAHDLGAHHFVVTKNKEQMKAARGSIDFLISAVTVDLDWKEYFKTLRKKGQLCIVGASPSDIPMPTGELISGQKSLVGSNTGGRPMINEMLHFAAQHQVKAKAEVVALKDVNKAIDKVRNNEARYRMVLECST